MTRIRNRELSSETLEYLELTFGSVAGLVLAVPVQVFILQPRDVGIVVVIVLLRRPS